ncbi:MAG: hypothetical protein KJ824_12030 [Alphaproteobacteria bacterium]|nr:hypothetical protein [Alphaproteobacteria bacterium]
MIDALFLAALITMSGQTQTQSPPEARPGSDITRSLNAAPPSAVIATPAPAPAAVAPEPRPETLPARSTPAATMSAAVASPVPPATTPRTAPASPSRVAVPPPSTAPAAPVATVAPTRPEVVPARPASNTPAPASVSPSPSAATTVLDAAAIAALPFTVELPAGLSVTTGRPGPDFDVWTIRRGQQPLVMVYAGPAAQFPIYSGEMVEAGGRASIVATEDGRRVALEHLFTRQTAPREIHVWLASVDGADRTLAERIGQSVDAR